MVKTPRDLWPRSRFRSGSAPITRQIKDPSAAARRCRFDANPPTDEADHRAGQGLFQPRPARPLHGPVQRRQQGLDLAEFRRPFMTDAIDRAQQQPQPDFLRQRGKGLRVEGLASKVLASNPAASVAIPQREIALGAVGQHFHRGIGAGEPRRQPRQIAASPPSAASTGINARSRGRVKPVSRLVGSSAKSILALFSVAMSCDFETSRNGRASSTPSRSVCRAIAARPAMPLPRSIRISSVSA